MPTRSRTTPATDRWCTTRVRIATWNLWGRYGPWEARLPVIIENLSAINADILALQEVWEDDTRNQADEIAAALGCTEPVYAANLERDGVRSGNAVLSRWPIARHEVRVLPRRGAHERDRRRGRRAPVRVRGGRRAARTDPDVLRAPQLVGRPQRDPPGAGRRRSAASSARRGPASFPAVLCGDLNADPQSDEIRMLTGRAASPVPRVIFRDAWEAAGNTEPGYTWSNDNPFAAASLDLDRRIDHVMVGRPKLGGVGHVRRARTSPATYPIDGMWGSDHLAVVAELRY